MFPTSEKGAESNRTQSNLLKGNDEVLSNSQGQERKPKQGTPQHNLDEFEYEDDFEEIKEESSNLNTSQTGKSSTKQNRSTNKNILTPQNVTSNKSNKSTDLTNLKKQSELNQNRTKRNQNSVLGDKILNPSKAVNFDLDQNIDVVLPSIHRHNPSLDFEEKKATFHKEKVRMIQTSEGKRIPHISLRFSNDNEGSMLDSPERNHDSQKELIDISKVSSYESLYDFS